MMVMKMAVAYILMVGSVESFGVCLKKESGGFCR